MLRGFVEERFEKTGIYYAFGITAISSIILQISGFWILMILTGAVGSFFVKNLKHAFVGGFLGVAVAWSIIFVFLVETAQAYVIAEFFANLIGLPGFGRGIVSISILIGGLLGASGAVAGRAFIDMIEETRFKKEESE